MGRSAYNRPTKKKSGKQARQKAAKLDTAASPEVLFERAQEAISREDYETALALLQRATELDPSNWEVNDAFGSLLAESGQAERAVEVLRRSVTISPDEGHEKYMYLGQLLAGEGAIASVSKGIEVIEGKLTQLREMISSGQDITGEAAWDADELTGQLSQAICSKAELLLSFTAEIEAVAEEAEVLLARAADVDPTNPEPLQVLCSLRVEQGRPDEALASLHKSMEIWFKPEADEADQAEGKAEEMDAGPGEEPMPGDDECGEGDDDAMEGFEDEDDEIPSYEFRMETVKLLLELEETTEKALQVVISLLDENDSVPDTWHIYAMCLHASCQFEDALKAVEDARGVCNKIKMSPDDDVLKSLDELEASIKDSMGDA